jgi:hypothetical protein
MGKLRSCGILVGLSAAAGAACGGGAPPFDPCDVGEPRLLIDDPVPTSRSQHHLLADEDGYLIFWAGALGTPEQSGVFALRPGGETVRLVRDVNAQLLAVAEVTAGFLVCWADTTTITGTPREGGCLVVDHDLAVIGGPTRPANGVVMALGRIGTELHAVLLPDGDFGPLARVAIDETGMTVGAESVTPCDFWRAGRAAWGPDGLACLVRSDPLCGDQFNEPPDCTHHLQLFAGDGSLLIDVPDVAPFGWYSQENDVHLAAAHDGSGFLVSWHDNIGTINWHGHHVSSDGTIDPAIDVLAGAAYGGALAAVPGGYAALWSVIVPTSGADRTVIDFFVVDTAGVPAGGPARLVDIDATLPRHYSSQATIGSTPGGGFGVVWEAAGGDNGADYRTGLYFRSLGCPF